MKKLFLLLLFLPTMFGCTVAAITAVGGAAGAAVKGIITWKDNEATKYYLVDVDVLHHAVEKSAKDLNFPITKDENKKETYHIQIGEKDKFKIEVSQVEKNISKVWIRVNFMGNKPYAELFYKTIDDNLNIVDFNNSTPSKKKSHQKEEPRRKLFKNRK